MLSPWKRSEPPERGFVNGTFVERLNRFSAKVKVRGEVTTAFLPNSGRLKELLVRGRTALLRPSGSAGRKTPFDLWGIFTGRIWVCVDSRMANRLLPRAVQEGLIPALRGVKDLKPEVPHGGKRFDFLASDGVEKVWVETKSVTLVKDKRALFPDAPTLRGREHILSLTKIVEGGGRAAVVFMVLREDAEVFSPNWETDPAFSSTLERAASKGVAVSAVRFRIAKGEVLAAGALPVELRW